MVDATVLAGILAWLALTLAPLAVWTVLLHGDGVVRALGPRVSRLRVAVRRPPAPAPRCRPLQEVAADLRRLYPAVHTPVPGTRMAKQRGVVLAYDEHLVVASTALEVTTSLLQLSPGGVDREIERLRVEHALADAGLVLTR